MNFDRQRRFMVEEQLRHRGIQDDRVLDAMGQVPRHLFVGEDLRDRAYEDCALPIGEGQTISQPYMVALMTELLELKGGETVLEVGTGSGYQSAVLSLLAAEVYTVERVSSLAEQARTTLKRNGFLNVHVRVSDGTLGLPDHAPYDGIIVTAGAPDIPRHLTDQLKIRGRLVIPVGDRHSQVLYQVTRTEGGIKQTVSTGCVFVPLIGKDGWEDETYH
ncbi:MAG: protein-L-isoaspartate(D-aspartate) O-methyltransferase [Nitrospiraceae bacterium]|nr:MAG: protein-L-isoaspartate(D-aspartate) O-methyltransferase [Nitrospiraceae bacterium]